MPDKLRLSEQRYRALVHNFPGGAILLFDHELRYLLADGQDMAEVGLSAEELVGKTIWEALAPETCRQIEPAYRAALAGRKTSQEITFRDQIYQVDFVPVLDEESSVLCGMVITRRVTQQRHAEAALRSINERYLRYQAALSVMSRLPVRDPERLGDALREVTERVAAALNVPQVEIWRFTADHASLVRESQFHADGQEHEAGAVLTKEQAPDLFEPFMMDPDVLALEDTASEPRIARLHADMLAPRGLRSGVRAQIRAHGEHVGVISCADLRPRAWAPDEQVFLGTVANLLSALFAHAAQVQSENERRELELQLRESHKMEALGTLAGGLAHDFNNILAAIVANIETLKLTVGKGSEKLAMLDDVAQAAARGTDLVRQILTFCRRQPLERRALQVAPILREALRLLRSTLPATIAFETRMEEGLPDVLADPTQLHQVFVNLGTNAGRAMRGTYGKLSVSLERAAAPAGCATSPEQTFLCVTMTDTGEGMSNEVKNRIFEPFFTTKDVGEGTGLGLSVVHGIVHELGAQISVSSQLGQGSTFRVFLPTLTTTAPNVPCPRDDAPRGENEQVLLVDDDPATLSALERLLRHSGYQVMAVTSGQDALNALSATPEAFDLLITDLTMPQMTGVELVTRCLAARPNLPVILTTGYSYYLSAETARSLGVGELLVKPLALPVLLQAIRRVLRNKDAPHATC